MSTKLKKKYLNSSPKRNQFSYKEGKGEKRKKY